MENKNSIVDLTFYATLLSAFFYSASWFYEFGFCNYFQIPSYYISVNAATILRDGGPIFYVISFLIFMDIIGSTGSNEEREFQSMVTSTLVFSALIVFDALSYGMDYENYFSAALGLTMFFLSAVYIPISFYSKHSKSEEKASWVKKYKFYYEHAVQRSELFEIASPLGLNSIRYLVIGFLLINLSYHAGYYTAKTETTYYSLSTNNIILREYGRRMISVRIIKVGSSYTYKFLNIVNMDSIGAINLSKITLLYPISRK